jgi:molybdopterin converting factor small subunit
MARMGKGRSFKMAMEIKFVSSGTQEEKNYVAFDGMTLGEFLEEFLKVRITDSVVTVNNRPIDNANYELRDGDRIQITPKTHKSGN